MQVLISNYANIWTDDPYNRQFATQIPSPVDSANGDWGDMVRIVGSRLQGRGKRKYYLPRWRNLAPHGTSGDQLSTWKHTCPSSSRNITTSRGIEGTTKTQGGAYVVDYIGKQM